jgi:hypothetical protein
MSRPEHLTQPGQPYWTHERIIEAIQLWAKEYGQPPAKNDWHPPRLKAAAQSALGKAHFWTERLRISNDDAWPREQTVRNRFGSWAAAIAAAGFEPRPPGRTPRTLEAKHLAQIRALQNGSVPGAATLSRALASVKEAAQTDDRMELRAALLKLAADALAYAESIEPLDNETGG